jgi:hypothetical protein
LITNLRQLDLNLLLVFDALMQEGNLTRAAERLHLSQSTVSNALARLRQQLAACLTFLWFSAMIAACPQRDPA